MADDTTVGTKTPEEKAANAKKKELRRLRGEIKIVREKAKDLAADRKKLEERHNELATELGLPPVGKKGKKEN
jgi:predicted nuclease with TOPRIM domain